MLEFFHVSVVRDNGVQTTQEDIDIDRLRQQRGQIVLAGGEAERVVDRDPLFADARDGAVALRGQRDFDDENWKESIFKLYSTCIKYEIPAYVERSRSGNGGHLWVFFEENLPAEQSNVQENHL